MLSASDSDKGLFLPVAAEDGAVPPHRPLGSLASRLWGECNDSGIPVGRPCPGQDRLSADPRPGEDIEIVGEAGSGEEGLPLIRRLKPQVVICDLHLPGISGLDITERIVRSDIGTHVLIVSVQEEGPMPRRLIEAGASVTWARAAMPRNWCAPCAKSPAVAAISPATLRSEWPWRNCAGRTRPSTCCHRRELEVARMLCQGMRMEEIGRRLSLSGKTVATHKYRLYEKLGIKDTVALARLAGQHGVSDPVTPSDRAKEKAPFGGPSSA